MLVKYAMAVLEVRHDKMKKLIILLTVIFFISGCQSPSPSSKQPSSKENLVSLVAVGDNLMHQRLLDTARQDNDYDFSPYYQNIRSYIQKADLAFVNQETILGGGKASGYPRFNTPDVMAKNLHDIGFDIVNGATNHALDQGKEAILHSINVFKQYQDMHYIGLYASSQERENICVVEKNGIKIAFLSYNQVNNVADSSADDCISMFDEKTIRQDVENAQEISDCIIVSCHWGNEYDVEPQPFQKKYAKLFADLGVDVVLGTHSHTLEPIEWVEGQEGHKTLVAYSLGNFISGMMEEETQLGGMLSFDLKKVDNQCVIESVVLTPLINHYEASDSKNVYDTREGFRVYRLKDYTEELASRHALQGYQGITISINKMKEKVKQRITSGIDIDM